MPKMKTHSGIKKRFKRTGTGEYRYKHSFRGHAMRRKNSKRKRRLERPGELSAADTRKVKRLLGA